MSKDASIGAKIITQSMKVVTVKFRSVATPAGSELEIVRNEHVKSFCNADKVLVLDLSCGSQVLLFTSSQYVIYVLYNFFLCIVFENKRFPEKKNVYHSPTN